MGYSKLIVLRQISLIKWELITENNAKLSGIQQFVDRLDAIIWGKAFVSGFTDQDIDLKIEELPKRSEWACHACNLKLHCDKAWKTKNSKGKCIKNWK